MIETKFGAAVLNIRKKLKDTSMFIKKKIPIKKKILFDKLYIKLKKRLLIINL